MTSRALRAAAAVLVLAAVAGTAYFAGRTGASPAPVSADASGAELGPLGDQARREADDPLATGALDAPVVLGMYSDYRCPFCARFSNVTEPQLIERFVESGDLRIEWRDFPVFGESSLMAARAGRAAAAQGRFWEFTRSVYEAAPERAHHDLTPSKLRDFAVQARVPDLDGTPSFVINGHPVVGAQPTAVFVDVVQRTLSAAGG